MDQADAPTCFERRTVTVLCVSSDGCLVDNRSGIRESGCYKQDGAAHTVNGASAQLAADKRFNFISKREQAFLIDV